MCRTCTRRQCCVPLIRQLEVLIHRRNGTRKHTTSRPCAIFNNIRPLLHITHHEMSNTLQSQVYKNEKLNMMKQKGVYLYDFMDSFEKFPKKKQLPNKNNFYSILNNEHITDDQYNHAKNIWNKFKLKKYG